jgi:hypothetical protein
LIREHVAQGMKVKFLAVVRLNRENREVELCASVGEKGTDSGEHLRLLANGNVQT